MSSILLTPNIDPIETTLSGGGVEFKPNQATINTVSADPNKPLVFEVQQEATDTLPAAVVSSDSARTLAQTGSGADTISGGFLSDTLDGGAGNDTISGGKGSDVILGGTGDDSIYGDSATPGTFIKDGNDTIYGGLGNDWIDGGSGNDLLYGQEGNDTIFGGTGDDQLFGGEGNDSLDGGDGNDKLFGGAGDDSLVGGAGDDTLEGAAGEDRLTGGAGADIFRILETDDEVDTITDFQTGVDKINLVGFGAGATVTYDSTTGMVKVNNVDVVKLDGNPAFDFDTVGGADFEIL